MLYSDMHGPWRTAAYLFGLGLVFRIVLAAWTTTIATDGGYYLAMAEAFAAGRVDEALGGFHGIHPLFPLLVSLLGASETAGYAVSGVAGAAAVVPLYFLARAWWDDRIALWTGLLFALHPTLADEGSEVMTTSVYLGLFTTAVALIVFAARKGKPFLFALAAAAAALCYLTRPEGLLLLPVFATAVCARLVVVLRRPPGAGRLLLGAAIFAVVFLAVASPYLLWIREHTGGWALTARPSAGAVAPSVAAEAPPPPSPTKEPVALVRPAAAPRVRSLGEVGRRFYGAVYSLLVPFLLLGFVAARGRWKTLAGPSALVLLTLAPPFVLHAVTGGTYGISRRYFLTASTFLLPWTAAGVVLAADFLSARLRGLGTWPAGRVMGVVLLACLAWRPLGPRRAEEAAFVEAGRWLRATARPAAVFSSRDKIAWYAGAKMVALPPVDVSEDPRRYAAYLAALGRSGGIAHAVLDDRSLRELPPGLPEALEAEAFRLERRFPEGEAGKLNPVRVYRLP